MSEPPSAPFVSIPTRHRVHPLESAVVDGRTGRVLLLSKSDSNRSKDRAVSSVNKSSKQITGDSVYHRESYLQPCDLCSVLHVRLFDEHHRAPSFSLDPADRNDPSGPRTRATHMPEDAVVDSFLGQMLYEADHHLKHLNFGVDVSEADGSLMRRKSNVKGYRSTSDIRFDRLKKAHESGSLTPEALAEPSYNRKWIVIDKASEEEQGDTLHFRGINMGVDTRVMVPDPSARMGLRDVESADDPDSNDFCDRMKSHYDELESECAQLGHVREMSKLVGLVDWIEQRGWGVNLTRLREVAGAADPCPTTREIKTVYDRQKGPVGDAFITQILCGGVDLSACKEKEQTQAADHEKILADGKYTDGSVGKDALVALDDLQSALEAMPEDSEEAAALKAKLRDEVAAMRKAIANGEPISDDDVAKLAEKLAAIAEEAAGDENAPADVALLAGKIGALGAALGGARFSKAGDPATNEAARESLTKNADALAAKIDDIAKRAGVSPEAKDGIQAELAGILERYPSLLSRPEGEHVDPTVATAFVADVEAAKEKFALSDDPDTRDLVAEVEDALAKTSGPISAAAAMLQASAAAKGAAAAAHTEAAVADLRGATKSAFSDDPEDAKAFREELADLLDGTDEGRAFQHLAHRDAHGHPGDTEAERAAIAAKNAKDADAFLEKLRALEEKHGGADNASDELKDAIAAAKRAREDAMRRAAARDPDALLAAAKALTKDDLYPVDKSEEAAAARKMIEAAIKEAEADGNKTVDPETGEKKLSGDAAAVLAAALAVAAKAHPGRDASADPQMAALGGALDALAESSAPPSGARLSPRAAAEKASRLADPSKTDNGGKEDAKALQDKIAEAIKAATPDGKDASDLSNWTDEELEALADAIAAVSRDNDPSEIAKAGGSEECVAIAAGLAAVAAAAAAGRDRMSPEAFVARARKLADPSKTDNGGSELAKSLQDDIAKCLGGDSAGDAERFATPEAVAALRGELEAVAKAHREKEKDKPKDDKDGDHARILGELDHLLSLPVETASTPPDDNRAFVEAARNIGDPAKTDVSGSERAKELQKEVAAAVAAVSAAKSSDKVSPAEAAKLASDLDKVLAKVAAEGDSDPDVARLGGALGSLLASREPGAGSAAGGVDGRKVKADLDAAAAASGPVETLPDDAAELSKKISAISRAVPDKSPLSEAEAERVLATIRAAIKEHADKYGDDASAEADRIADALKATEKRVAADIAASEAAKRAAIAAGLGAALGSVMALAAESGISSVELGDLHGECADLLRCSQFSRGKLSGTDHGKRGGEKSRFGSNPRYIVTDASGVGGEIQLVLTVKDGADIGRPYLYAFRASGEFAPCVQWWSKDSLLDAAQRVAGRQVRIDTKLAAGETLVVIPATEIAVDAEFTVTVHSEQACHVCPLLWVPAENAAASIFTARGDFNGTTVDLGQVTEWSKNPAIAIDVKKGGKFYVLLRSSVNAGCNMRIDLARNKDDAAASHLLTDHEVIDPPENLAYDALPEMFRGYTLEEGKHFIVPSTIKGTEGEWQVEIYGARDSFVASLPDENAARSVAEVEHDPSVVPRAIGTNGHVTF